MAGTPEEEWQRLYMQGSSDGILGKISSFSFERNSQAYQQGLQRGVNSYYAVDSCLLLRHFVENTDNPLFKLQESFKLK